MRWREILGLPENRVRVVAPDVGGGFGVKAIVYPEDVVLCLLAMRLERPVKWVETRREGFMASAHARDHRYAVRAGFDADGTPDRHGRPRRLQCRRVLRLSVDGGHRGRSWPAAC